MKVAVHLHGYFKDFHDGPLMVEASTIAHAIEIVTRQLKGFLPNAVQGRHRISVANCSYKDLWDPLEREEIHLTPQIAYSKQGGFLQILIGIVLVGVGLLTGQPWLIKIGALVALGGLAQLLSPQPEEDQGDNRKSRYLGAPKNTVGIGTRIPILYGTHKVYGHWLAFDVDAKDVKAGD